MGNKLFLSIFIISLFLPHASMAKEKTPAVATYNKAMHYYQDRKWEKARELFHQYLAEYSDTPLYITCLYYLAYCYQQLKETKQAMMLYHKVIDQAVDEQEFWAEVSKRRLQELETANANSLN